MHRIRQCWVFVLWLACGALLVSGARAASNEFADTTERMLAAGQHPYVDAGRLQQELAPLRALYGRYRYGPVWLNAGKPSGQTLRWVRLLGMADAYGLRAADYDLGVIQAHLSALAAQRRDQPEYWAELDVALSTAALRFIRHLHYGRIDPRSAGFDLSQPRADLDLAAAVEKLARENDTAAVVKTFEPPFHHYQLLKIALARYRELSEDASLTALPAFAGRSIKPGESYAGAQALRRLLVSLGDLPSDAVLPGDPVLDESLVTALRSFQERHGLTVDGALGKQTFAALSTPLAQRVRQIELTLERWRWLPSFATPPIIVNIPQFRLFALQTTEDREAGMLSMEVVVGRAYQGSRTPVFLDDLTYVVFRPYWDVPYSITVREILPQLVRDPAYLARNHFELVRGQTDHSPVVPATPENIAALSSGAVRVRQAPGPDNALGAVKFMLPNAHNVYLHDTPAQRLFKESRRAFSHGCIRVSNPAALAEYVLRHASGDWTPESIAQAMNGAPNQRVDLTQPIRVMILYGTAVAAESGRIFFFDDLYAHDRRLEQLLGLR